MTDDILRYIWISDIFGNPRIYLHKIFPSQKSRPHTDREIDDEVRFTRLDGETESGQSPGYD